MIHKGHENSVIKTTRFTHHLRLITAHDLSRLT